MAVNPGLGLVLLCVAMVVVAALVYRFARLGSPAAVPAAAGRAVVQLSLIAVILAAAMRHVWSAVLVLLVMFGAAAYTCARRAEAGRSGTRLTLAIAAGITAVLPPTLLSGVVPLHGVTLHGRVGHSPWRFHRRTAHERVGPVSRSRADPGPDRADALASLRGRGQLAGIVRADSALGRSRHPTLAQLCVPPRVSAARTDPRPRSTTRSRRPGCARRCRSYVVPSWLFAARTPRRTQQHRAGGTSPPGRRGSAVRAARSGPRSPTWASRRATAGDWSITISAARPR